jgi:folate-dependent phosphoribosylglycinamide formyltransferase PurN
MKIRKIAFITPEDNRMSTPAIKKFITGYKNYEIKFVVIQKDFFKFKKKISLLFIFTIKELIKIFFKKKINFSHFCKKKKIEIVYKKNVNVDEIIIQLKKYKINYLVIVSSNNIIKKKLLNVKNLKILNFHTSKLPKYRGILPIFRAYSNNEKHLGFTIHKVNRKIDDGIILSQKIIKINKKRGLLQLYETAFRIFPKLLNDAIQKPLNKINSYNESSYYSYPKIYELFKFRLERMLNL